MELWLRVSGVKISVTSNWDYGDLVDSQNVDYVANGSEWGQNASDLNSNLKWWGVSTDETLRPEGIWQDSSFARTRVDILGIGRSVQFTFQMNGGGSAEILAYRPDLRSKGLL
jgi:hypothetical protein